MRIFWTVATSLSVLSALTACGGGGGSTFTAPIPPPVQAVNQAPSFSSAPTVSMDENALGDVYTVEANDADGTITSLTLQATGDAELFEFDPATGALSLPDRLNFDEPIDVNGDNIYTLSFEAIDDDNESAILNLSLTITEARLKARLPPSGNFELIDWRLDRPVNSNEELTGLADILQEDELAAGHQSEWFFTGPDGGLVMRAPVIGATTSGSRFARTELREMLRRGDRSIRARGDGDRPNLNNWTFSSAPQSAQDTAGGVDGTLRVTMAVNTVTTTGASNQVGRLIIGQIHAEDDEPIRLYYRKLPGNENGVIYAEHELRGGEDIRFDIIGDSSNDADNPVDGFALDEQFTYDIIAVGNTITTIISQDGLTIGSLDIDISDSGYDVEDDFLYFKAGTYHIVDTADPSEEAQTTIYELTNTHDGYPF